MSGTNYTGYQVTDDEREKWIRQAREQEIQKRIKSHIAENPPSGDAKATPAYATIRSNAGTEESKMQVINKNYFDEVNLRKLAAEIADMDYSKFTEGDDYASLAKRYSQQGQKAMDDTIGKVAARTGGMASSYATAAGNQAYNDWMGNLEDAARSLYDSQRQEKIDNLGIAKSLYDMSYNEQRDNIADNNTRFNQNQTLKTSEIGSLQAELYYNSNAYPTYVDYEKAFPGTLLTESEFNQIKSTVTGMYAEDNKEVEPVDTGNLTEYQRAIIDQYNRAKGEDGDGDVPEWLQEAYEEIFGSPTKVKNYKDQIAAATTYQQAQEWWFKLFQIDEQAANEALEAWEEAHSEPDPK